MPAIPVAIAFPIWHALVVSTSQRSDAPPSDDVRVLSVDDNGGWCWYQDERAAADAAQGIVLLGSVASSGGAEGARRGGDVNVSVVDLGAGTARTVTLHAGLESDDHDVPALWKRSDGRWVAVYTKHGADTLTRWRISEPEDPTVWGPERVFDWSTDLTHPADAEVAAANRTGATYQNIHELDGVLHCFVRSINLDPCVLVSHDDGESWEFGGRLLTRDTIAQSYVRYASGNRFGQDDRIDLIVTERHPRVHPTSIWHGYLSGGQLHRTDGTVVGPLGRRLAEATPAVEGLTQVLAHGAVDEGAVLTHCWTIDLRRGEDGTVVGIFSARVDDPYGRDYRERGEDLTAHRFLRGVLAPGAAEWVVRPLAEAGPELYYAEQDYTGLVSIDPDDLSALYLSTPIDPRDGSALARHGVFHGRTRDDGLTWDWRPLAVEAEAMNLRPIAVPGDPQRSIVAWLRGEFRTYTDYDTEIVLRVAPRA
ncbi:hypothetical protein GCM10009793_30020 [Brachybacterium phenoliresistens]